MGAQLGRAPRGRAPRAVEQEETRANAGTRLFALWSDILRVWTSNEAIAEFGARLGLDPGQLRLFQALSSGEGRRLSDLAEAGDMTPSYASRLVQDLVSRGLLERSTPEDDRRVTVLTLTESGEALRNRIDVEGGAMWAEHLDSFTDEEVRSFETLLAKLAKAQIRRRMAG